MNQLLSVVIAAFNHVEYIDDAIKSALAQSYDEFEVIVVDDGSDDGTRQAISKYASALTIVDVERGGPSACLNAGLRVCRGSFIAVMSGDDLSEPDRLTVQLNTAFRCNSDILFCVPNVVDGLGRPLTDSQFPAFLPRSASSDIDLSDLFYNGNYLCATSAFIRTSLLQDVGFFDESLVQLSDYEYWMRAMGSGFQLNLSLNRNVKYRRHNQNLSGPNTISGSDAEAPYILDRVLKSARPGVFRDSFANFLPPGEKGGAPLSNFEAALILFAHDSAAVRSMGIPYYDAARRSGELDALPNFCRTSFLINSLKRDPSA
ncbi:Putative glycosyltransferase EpsH [Variovorax sp. PBS-H4]|uniref:glycosyltransferase family 2 protein n=1 Tax=Variovorax sp. PBS-H4 TaxID=434008 RepID=UPI0013162047|nr:glycosyltransferase [Variovorax sp. PBS-H4]VTU21349.1 Putative glycosyltransferase EpsH [Variovorax sp. PBS-H4]